MTSEMSILTVLKDEAKFSFYVFLRLFFLQNYVTLKVHKLLKSRKVEVNIKT